MIKCIHYGSKKFDSTKIGNDFNSHPYKFLNKPYGCLYASPMDARLSWKNFCIDEKYNTDRLKNYFKFNLDPRTTLIISTESDYIRFYKNFKDVKASVNETIGSGTIYKLIDWNAVAKKYDAVVIYISNFSWDFCFKNTLYNWDVDTAVIFNANAVQMKRIR